MLKADNRKYSIRSAKPLAAVGMLMLWACSVEPLSPEGGSSTKSPIELSVGIAGNGADVATKTVVTTDNPYGQAAQAFNANTSLYMVMKSENASTSPTETKYTRTLGTVSANAEPVFFSNDFKRYYEDAHSRNTFLSIYSACVPGKANGLTIGGSSTYNTNSWSTTAESTTISWPLGGTEVGDQTGDFIGNQDFCFSNNISKLGSENRIAFNTTTKKFTTDLASGTAPERGGRMIFYHALTKVTFKIKKGNGFEDAEFTFTNANENIELKGFNTSGTFDLTTGEFTSIGTATIKNLADTKDATADAAYKYVLSCLMLPGSELTSTATDQINLTIGHNTYHLTKKHLQDALSEKKLSDNTAALTDDHKMRPGVHYIFLLEIGKKTVDDIKAAVVQWEEVESDEMLPTNAKITVSLLDKGTLKTGDPATFDLYRLQGTSPSDIDHDHADYTWMTGYVPTATPSINKAYLVENEPTNSGIYTAKNYETPHTEWYWANNKTFYHFRTVMPVNHPVKENGEGDFIGLARGTTAGTANYIDVCWGAPFNYIDVDNGTRLEYSFANGFDKKNGEAPAYTSSQISKAIGPTEGTIILEMFHMMSDVTIKLTTPKTGDADAAAAVTLDGVSATLTDTYPTGNVLMGNGKVIPTGSKGDITPTFTYDGTHIESRLENYGFVPQSLKDVKLIITTSDHNRYEVDMKDVVATAVGNNLIKTPYSTNASGKYIINAWYPNYKYTYTFKLKKTGIAEISATLAEWENVVADDQEVVIK